MVRKLWETPEQGSVVGLPVTSSADQSAASIDKSPAYPGPGNTHAVACPQCGSYNTHWKQNARLICGQCGYGDTST